MKNRGIYYTLAIIIVAGITITTCTNYFLRGASRTESAAAYEQEFLMDMAEVSEADGGVFSRGMSGGADEKTTDSKAMENGKTETVAAESIESEEVMPEGRNREPGEPEAAMAEEFAVSAAGGPALDSVGAGTEVQSKMAAADENGDVSRSTGKTGNSGSSGSTEGSSADKSAGGDSIKIQIESVSISPLETTAAESQLNSASNNGTNTVTASAAVSYYRERLLELDAQIQKNRENQSASNINASTKNAAASELKLWDNELNLVYSEIMDRLNETQAEELVKEEREWIKERDRLAADAAKASAGGSLESVEYTVSLAETTRQRAYELVDTYEYLLMD